MLFVLKSDEPLVRVFRINFMALECLFYSFIGNRQIAKVQSWSWTWAADQLGSCLYLEPDLLAKFTGFSGNWVLNEKRKITAACINKSHFLSWRAPKLKWKIGNERVEFLSECLSSYSQEWGSIISVQYKFILCVVIKYILSVIKLFVCLLYIKDLIHWFGIKPHHNPTLECVQIPAWNAQQAHYV